jgi:hypothetical protein
LLATFIFRFEVSWALSTRERQVAGLSASDHGYLAYTILEDLLANMDQFVAAITVKEQEEIHQLRLSVAKERETIAAMRAGNERQVIALTSPE